MCWRNVYELLLGAAGKELPLNQSEIADKLLGFSAKDEKRALAFLNASVQEARAAQEREQATRDAQLAKGKGIKSALEQDTSVEFGLDAQGRRTIKWYQHQAERGLATAQFQLAKYYELGIETPVDMKEAVRWYRSAAELEYPDAQYYFAMLNYYAIGVDRNEVLAQSLIKSAAQQGHAAAKRALDGAGFATARQSMALWWLTRSGQEKNALAIRQAGNLYELGRGAHADINEARKYYQAATALGFSAVSQSAVPSIQRVAVDPAATETVKEKEGPVKSQVSTKSTQDTSTLISPGIQSKLTTWFALPWIKYSVFALVALVPISAFFWVAMKEKRRLTESKKKPRSRPAVV
ncbi:MAG: sel1 repeat family protein [Gammaproteobacteria bacterium]|nr:sel1 repeat family protein [Gammaproteobacteria bacterium]